MLYKAIYLLILQVSFLTSSYGQQIFHSKNGTLEIISPKPQLVAHSKGLEVLLDYTNAFVEFELPLNTLHATSDTMNTHLKKIENTSVWLKADLQLDRINTQRHPTQHFVFIGEMDYQDVKFPITGEGHLEHLDGNQEVSCLLGMSFWIIPAQFRILEFESWSIDSLKIQIVQVVLNEKIELHK